MDFRSLSSWAKLAAWAAAVTVIMCLMQAAMWLVGWQGTVLDNGTPLLLVALLSLMLLMSIDRRPLSDYGAIVGPVWRRLLLRGLGAGLLTYAAYAGLAVALGAYELQFSEVSPNRLAKAVLKAMTAMPLAATQQFIFSGYLLAMLRERCSRLVAVIVSSALFAVMNRVENLPSLVEPQTQQLILGLFLTAALLNVLRLLTGSIIVPTGLLAGWIFVDRFAHVLQLLRPNLESPWHDWLAPGGDLRQAPALALLLTAGLVICWLVLRRRGEGKAPLSEQAIHADFKRVFPFSHTHMLAPLDLWIGRLIVARFRIGLDYVPRLLAILVLSAANTVLTLPERLLMPWLLRRRRQVLDPLFILGVHRSGTTYLHNLLALDPQFCTPRTFHIMNPHGCVFSGWLLAPLWAVVLPWKRPMDNVPFHLFSAQEEEFAISGSCSLSPYWGLTFPQQGGYYDKFIFLDSLPAAQQSKWRRHYHRFLQKLTYWSGKRPLLKSPHNTARAGTLRTLYPNARFIHICRHPYDVYRSNMHLAREGLVTYQLHDSNETDSYSTRFLENYHAMESAWQRDAGDLLPGQRIEVRFEDLERDPLAVVRRIYRELGMELTSQFEQRLHRYVQAHAGYVKNKHHVLNPVVRAKIDAKMGGFMEDWGYQDDQVNSRRAAA